MSAGELSIPVPGPGRNSKYQDDYADQAFKLCLLGHTDQQLADFFEVSVATINNWKNEYPAFLESIRDGKEKADAEVAHSLYRRATGEVVEVEKLVKDSEGRYARMTIKQYVEPDTQAARLWLMNRQSKKWRDKVELDANAEINVHINARAEDF